MARKTKEVEKPIEKNIEEPKKVAKNAEKKAVSKTTKSTSAKKVTTKKTATKTASVKKTPVTKKTASKKTETNKKTTTKKTEVSKKPSTKKSTTVKKNTTKKTSNTKKATIKKTTSVKKENNKKAFSIEYYDLPYRYNQTIVTILAQTPKNLFVYWDISDIDRKNLENQFGNHFFEITKPVLIVHNDTMNYSFEIDIDDFANSWYIPVNDSNCDYRIELGRRPIPINYNHIQNYNNEEIHPVETPYIYLTSSNEIKSPNNKILFNLGNNICFRNVKTNQVVVKDISDFLLLSNIGRFYNLFDLYKHFYKDEELLTKEFDLINSSSSGNPSSGSFSSQFK